LTAYCNARPVRSQEAIDFFISLAKNNEILSEAMKRTLVRAVGAETVAKICSELGISDSRFHFRDPRRSSN
jgi:hypothetical protein